LGSIFTRKDGWQVLLTEIRRRLTEAEAQLPTIGGPGSSENDATLGGVISDLREVLDDYEASRPRLIRAQHPENPTQARADGVDNGGGF